MDGTCSLVEGCIRPDTTGGGCVQHKFGGRIRVNGLTLFAHDRKVGVTQAQKAKEMFEGAKETGKDITRVRGGRTATEVHRNGQWQET